MKRTRFTKDFRSVYVHIGLDKEVKEQLDATTGKFSVMSKTGLINALLRNYFVAKKNNSAVMNLP